MSDLPKNLDDGIQTNVVILNFSKAFYKFNHQKLLLKLVMQAISNQVAAWVESFLSGRIQIVVAEDVKPEQAVFTSGVLQGSIIGQVLFLFYINDLPETFFADDIILYHKSDDAATLQDDPEEVKALERLDIGISFTPVQIHHIRKERETYHYLPRAALHHNI